jgi:hypothetical protein
MQCGVDGKGDIPDAHKHAGAPVGWIVGIDLDRGIMRIEGS